MMIKTADGERSVGSAGVAGAGLGLGIAGTALALLNNNGNGGILGNLFGNGCGCGNNQVNQDSRIISSLEMQLAQEKAERYADMTGINTFKEAKAMVEKQGEVVAALASAFAEADKRNAVAEAVNAEKLKCLNERVTVLEGITKVVVPNSSICPGWGTVTITPSTTPTTAG
jgi:hypothetical protein